MAITLIAILHHIDDYERARSIVARLTEAVPSGSYLAIAHSTNVIYGAASDEAVGRWNKFGKPPVTLRSPEAARPGRHRRPGPRGGPVLRPGPQTLIIGGLAF